MRKKTAEERFEDWWDDNGRPRNDADIEAYLNDATYHAAIDARRHITREGFMAASPAYEAENAAMREAIKGWCEDRCGFCGGFNDDPACPLYPYNEDAPEKNT